MQIRWVQPACDPLQDGLRAAMSTVHAAHHKTELPARQHGLCSCSRASHAAYRCYTSRQSAGHAAASRQARAATLCRHTCRMLESDAVVSMCKVNRGLSSGSSSKGWLSEVTLRCVAAGRRSALDVSSTLSVRREDLRRFTMGAGRMSLPILHALRDSDRVWMGTRRRRVC